ncbi:hypothetical protein [Pseudomonas gingeri]|uniref:hypothetical protein n=1 Tax=Pseudomonas gingeri TaxID=117681 RepID=UPI0015A13392|nr:hypothetical protein [Pseudomonas gingeri]NVZ64648.1 hypothetical protein [Pseudomonas gingeri]NVZ73993.1 hypothetical protein [Pseudomonas gingeri]NWA05059.1 hypothetical protein [Pseudomonas gingeri]NWA16342.1 hypothetical protein [Pseudomonas gingeri]NWA54774.1 hypothetical protein [Pseudomonas gingeri]
MSESKPVRVASVGAPTDGRSRPAEEIESPRTLDAPAFPDVLERVWGETSFTLPIYFHPLPLRVVIEHPWPYTAHEEEEQETWVYFILDNQDIPELTLSIIGAYELDDVFPIEVDIPPELLGPGVHRVSYRVVGNFIGTNPSFVAAINYDQTQPNQGNPGGELIFDDEVSLYGITEAYLNTHQGATALVPRWSDVSVEDEVYYYWSPTAHLGRVGVLPITQAQAMGAPIEITFSESDIRTHGSGIRYASYRLADRAGNIGPFCDPPSEINVSLVALPIRLPRPEVPLADSDGLIDLADARAPTVVVIQEIVDAEIGDIVRIYWNIHELASFTVEGPIPVWPVSRPISWDIVSSGGFDARVPAVVFYRLYRGVPFVPSPNNFFDVDLTVAGPDPEGPDPINRLLPLVTVKGITADNVITLADRDTTIRVVVPLYASAQPGERLELMWGDDSKLASFYTVRAGDTEAVFFVPWEFVEANGSHLALPVYYWTDNGVNRQRSGPTSVRVAIDRITGLKPPLFTHGNDRFINCNTLPPPWLGVHVEIPGDSSRLATGDEIVLHWKSYPTPNTTGEPFPETVKSFRHVLADNEAANGYTFIIPFSPYITLPGLTPSFGSADTYYDLNKADGGFGGSEDSWIRIDLTRSGSPPCLGDDAVG